MASNSVRGIHGVLVNGQVDVVGGLNEISDEAGVARIDRAGKSCLIRTRSNEAGRGRRRKNFVLEDGGKLVGVMPIDGIEIKVLEAKSDVYLVTADGAGALAQNGSEALIARGRKCLQRGVINEGNTGRRGRNRKLGDLNADGFIDGTKVGQEFTFKVSLVPVREQWSARTAAKPRRSIYL